MPDSLLLYWFPLKPNTGISPFPSSPLDLVYSKSFISICLGDPVVYLALSLLSKQYQHMPTMLPTCPTSTHWCSSPSAMSTAMVDTLFFNSRCNLHLGAYPLISFMLCGSLSSIWSFSRLAHRCLQHPGWWRTILPATPNNLCHFQHLCPPCPHYSHAIAVLCALEQCSTCWMLICLFPACPSVLPIPVLSSSLSLPLLPTAFSLSSMLSPAMSVLFISYTLVSPDTSHVVPYYHR